MDPGGPCCQQPVFAAGMVLMELHLQGGRMQDSPGTVGALHALQSCTAMVHPGELVFGAMGCPGAGQERDGRKQGCFQVHFVIYLLPKCLWRWPPEHLGTSQ